MIAAALGILTLVAIYLFIGILVAGHVGGGPKKVHAEIDRVKADPESPWAVDYARRLTWAILTWPIYLPLYFLRGRK